jgi:hypothetical protein
MPTHRPPMSTPITASTVPGVPFNSTAPARAIASPMSASNPEPTLRHCLGRTNRRFTSGLRWFQEAVVFQGWPIAEPRITCEA